MNYRFTKSFDFSASFSRGSKVYGHNYTLCVTTQGLPLNGENEFEDKIKEVLISSVDSKDLGMHVDFLQGIEITDQNLLTKFAQIIQSVIKPTQLHSLSLHRDKKTMTELLLATR